MTTQANLTIDVLRTLHRIHRQLADLRERLARGPRVAQARQANVKRLEEALAKTLAEAKALRMAADDKQVQLKGGEEKIQKYQRQLNEAKTNAEYQALKEQIAAVRMVNSVLEDEILEAMEKVDQFKLNVDQAQADLALARSEAEKAGREAQKQEPALQADIQRAEAELREHEAGLTGELRDLYTRLIRHRGDDALAPLDGEFCGGCNQHVPLNMVSQVKMNRPIFCKSCGRLLYEAEGAGKGAGASDE